MSLIDDVGQQSIYAALIQQHGELRIPYIQVGDAYMSKLSDRVEVRLEEEEAVIYLRDA